MKKYILALIGTLLFVTIMVMFYTYGKNRYYDYHNIKLHSKLLKETVVDLRDSDNQEGVYKKIYRRYDCFYTDSTEKYKRIDNLHGIRYFINDVGDTVCMEFIDYSNFPRRGE